MATKGKQTKKIESWKIYGGVIVLIAFGYLYFGGDDTPTTTKTAAAPIAPKAAGPADAFLPVDYKATYPALKVDAKDAFLPLVRKAPAGDADKGLPSSITGGGSWSYDGTVSVDNKVQGLLDETKTGESDYVTVGEHWKHGRIKRITDDSIELAGDDGTNATMKMGVPTEASEKKAAPQNNFNDAMNQPAAISGPIGPLDLTPLPNANGSFNGGGNGFGNGRRGNRGGGGRRGRGGGGGGFGFGGG